MAYLKQYLKDYKKPDFQITSVHLYFNLEPQKTLVTASIVFKKSPDDKNNAIKDLVLNGEQLKLISLKLNEQDLTSDQYKVSNEHLTVFNVPAEFTLQTVVEINPEANKSCEGLYFSKNLYSTQCEAESFRRITYFLDRPDVLTTYTVEIEADKKYPVMLSNGNLLAKKDLDNGRHWSKWNDPFKKPSYLFALVAGDLGVIKDTFITKSNRTIQLEIYAPHGKQDRCHHAMKSLKKSMKWDEDRFGLEYDLDQFMIVSNDDFNMGAMENKGLNIFNSKLILADEKTATDTDFFMIESVIGHEYFHNWTGNRVTCRNWFELSLKEGLTVYRDQEFSADMNSREKQRISDVDRLRIHQFAEDAGPNAHPVRPDSCLSPDNFYTATIYEKGAEVIRMMATLVGRDGFRKGMDEYFKRYDGMAVTIDDFAAAISEPNKQDFTQFKLWYSQAGTPVITVQENYNEDAKTYSVTISQHCDLTLKEKEDGLTNKKPFVIPLLFGLIDAQGKELKLDKSLLVLNEKKQTWTFNDIKTKPVLSLNREFSAPIKIQPYLSSDDLIHLIKYDTDAFNRREACMTLLLTEVRRLIKDYKATIHTSTDTATNVTNNTIKNSVTESMKNAVTNSPKAGTHNNATLSTDPKIIEALSFVLNDKSIDPEFKDLILTLPSDSIIAQEEAVLDAVAFAEAKIQITKNFVLKNEDVIYNLYLEHHTKNTAGDRALKNRLLKYLVRIHPEKYVDLAHRQYQTAQNMTDTCAALEALCLTNHEYKKLDLNDFHEKWKKDAVVYTKWVSLQSTAPVATAFEDVLACWKAPTFDNSNPNTLYALHRNLGSNFIAFHTDNYPTYSWMADEILRVDKFNPQVAARVAGVFNLNKKLPDHLKVKANTEVQRMLAEKDLSKNVKELLEKIVF